MGSTFDRQFERLERYRRDLFARVDGMDDARFNRQPGENEWSVAQVMSHLLTAESSTLAYVRKKLAHREGLEDSGIGARVKSTLLALALSSPLRFKAPPGVGEVPARAELETIRRQWDELRGEWKTTIDSFPPELRNKAIFRHPVAGRMNLGQALKFMEDHIRHHTVQVERTLARIG